MAASKAETPVNSKPLNSIGSIDLERQSSSSGSDNNSTNNSTSSPRAAPSSPPNNLRCDPSIVEIGADETLWNPDRTRYGGYLLPPKEFLELKGSHDEIMKIVDDFLDKQYAPLTAEEQAQQERWLNAAIGPMDEPVDQADIDEAMEWC